MRLDLIVGPNGAGKSTFVDLVLAAQLPGSPFVNADLIAASRWPNAAERHSYEAAQIAERTRTALIAGRRAFLAETVFSHPSKLELIRQAKDAGYAVALHVVLVPEDLAVARVARRVRSGGHSVPEGKIRGRYRRLWPLVAEAIALADSAAVYDNSADDGPRLLTSFHSGVRDARPQWPAWTPQELRGL